PHKIAHAVDDNGNDVTDIVSTLDEKYLDNFGRGRYQGVTRDHYVEIDLGADAPQSGPLWLIAKGWMHPTDSSINVAISQGQEIHAQPLSMEVGDEMSLRFPEQPPPPAGWVRDYILMGDGWIKDGDYNSTFSRTVLPLPYHAKQEYTTAPGRLEDEWVYKQHREDWQKYHTRYVTPAVFQNALRSTGNR